MAELIGQKIDRYEILEKIGTGGMATVYKALDTRLDREVAIKFIKREVFPPEQLDVILKRFEREAKSLGRLSHPNIVSVLDYGEYDGAPYLVMNYLPGGTLKQKLENPMPWREAVQLILPIAHALQYIHSHNIINRDVKPSNILLTEDDQALLTDFGLAKLFEEKGTQLTASGAGLGTPDYMSPEQWTGEATVLSDMYSLGVVLYEMITGHRPYVSDTPAGVLLKQVNEPLPPPNQYIPDLPKNIESLLLKVLARKPEDRYLNMNAFADELQNVLAGGDAAAAAIETEKLRRQMTGGVKAQEIGQAREPIKQTEEWKSEPLPQAPQRVKQKQMLPIIIAVIVGAFLLLVLCGGCLLVYYFGMSAMATPTALAVTETPLSPPTSTEMPLSLPTSTEKPLPPSPVKTDIPVAPTPAPIGEAVRSSSYEVTVVSARELARVYMGNYYHYPENGKTFVEVVVKISNLTGSRASVPWEKIYVIEESGDSWYPNWSGFKAVATGKKVDGSTVGVNATVDGKSTVDFQEDAFLRAIWYVSKQSGSTTLLFVFDDSPQIKIMIP